MKKMNIIYEDKDLLVVEKESNVLTISSPKEHEHTLYHEVSTYVKKQFPKNKIFIVHRLDKDTSGLVIFSKNQAKKIELQNNWENVKRSYYAIVEGKMPKEKGILKSYLAEDKTLRVYSTSNPRIGKLAITEYEVLNYSNNFTLLRINIKTGRKNQIRVQLSDINHPIVGDKKYGSKYNPIRRLLLHAYLIDINSKDKCYHFETPYPKSFSQIIKK